MAADRVRSAGTGVHGAKAAPLAGGRAPAADRRAWAGAAAGLFGIGWGANQFASLLPAYHEHTHLTVTADQALLGIYALGLVPALLLGGRASDRWGRARLARPAAVTSPLATLILMAGARSIPALYAGRLLAGAVTGVALAAGTAWVKELSQAPYDSAADPQAGARRAAIALSAGFGLGPLAAGLTAQWGPAPLVVPYVPHLAVMAAVLPVLWRAPETLPDTGTPAARSSLMPGLLTSRAGRRRFRTGVAVLAPWVFAAPTVAFAVLPLAAQARISAFATAFAGLTAALTLGAGVAIQPLARRLGTSGVTRTARAGLTTTALGMTLASLAVFSQSIPLILLAAIILGAAYGTILVAGLLKVQRMAGPTDLAGLTAVYYALTYTGFAAPLVLAELSRAASYPQLLLLLAALAIATVPLIRPGRHQLPHDADLAELAEEPRLPIGPGRYDSGSGGTPGGVNPMIWP